jgi:DNA-directed RNA polymerase subunit M/transcription elongation factor TFIIS
MSEELFEYEANREVGLEVLSTVLKSENNVKIIEKYVNLNIVNKFEKDEGHNNEEHNQDINQSINEDINELREEKYIEDYNALIYEIVGDIVSGVNLKEMLNNLKTGIVGWKHPVFNDIRTKIEEHDEFIMNPFEVEEGALTCAKCGCNKTYSYSKQTRSADEPMSTFAQCLNCKAKWVYSG